MATLEEAQIHIEQCVKIDRLEAALFDSTCRGPTLRQWYAGLAMQGILSEMDMGEREMLQDDGHSIPKFVADLSLEYADALIEAEKK